MDNLYVVMFGFWPAVVVLCGGINMLVTWTFSWSELIFDYLIGVVAGAFLFLGTQPNPHPAVIFFLVFSHGLFGFLWWISDSFRKAFAHPSTFFWTLAAIRLGATLWAAAWDHLSVHLGAKFKPGPGFFSLVVAPAKLPFAWYTSAVGFVIWIVGAIYAMASSKKTAPASTGTAAPASPGKAASKSGKAGFAGGVFFTEFSPGSDDDVYATTIGFTIHTWYGNCPFEHELYHTRQYIYMCDWLMPFWVLGMLWGVISAAAASDESVSYALAIGADPKEEIGNPIEVAATHLAA